MQADGGGGSGGGSGGASFALCHAHPLAPRGSGTTSEVARSSLDLPEGLPPGDAARLVSGAATSKVARPSLDLPPGDAAEPVAAPAAADHVWQDYNAPAAKRRRLRRSPYFRRGVQCAFGTAAILAVISIPAVFDALSLDPRTGTVFILGEAAVRSRAAAQRMQPCWRSRALRLAGLLPCAMQGGASTPAAAAADLHSSETPPPCPPASVLLHRPPGCALLWRGAAQSGGGAAVGQRAGHWTGLGRCVLRFAAGPGSVASAARRLDVWRGPGACHPTCHGISLADHTLPRCWHVFGCLATGEGTAPPLLTHCRPCSDLPHFCNQWQLLPRYSSQGSAHGAPVGCVGPFTVAATEESTAHSTTTAFPSQLAAQRRIPLHCCGNASPGLTSHRLLCMLSLQPLPQPPSCSASQQCASRTLATQPSTLPLP